MNYQDFLETIETAISERMPENCTIQVQPFQKNNGITYDGLIISTPNVNISPTIYLNPYYHRYLNGVSLDEIYQDIINTYRRHELTSDFDIENYTDFEKVKSTIIMKLVNYESNLSLLENVAHVKYLDLAIIFQSLMCCKNFEYGTITIQKSHMEEWGVTTDDLMELALSNMPKLLNYKLTSLDEIVEHMLSDDLDIDEIPPSLPMYILTNSANINGATCILYKGLLRKISEDFGKDLIIIPSSIHEVIIVPTDSCQNLDFYTHMVQEVNSTELIDEQILSDHVYYYSLWNDQLSDPRLYKHTSQYTS